MSESRAAVSVRDRLRVVQGEGGSRPASIVTLRTVLACALWVAIVWLLFASLIETRQVQQVRVINPGVGGHQQAPRAPSR